MSGHGAEFVAAEVAFAKIAAANGDAQGALVRLRDLDLTEVDQSTVDDVQFTIAGALEVTGAHAEAIEVTEPLLARARAQRRWVDAAAYAMLLVAAYMETGDFARSVEVGEEVVAALESAGLAGTDEHVRLAATLVGTYHERGDVVFALHRASAVMTVAEQVGSAQARGSIYWNAALCAQDLGDHTTARKLAERALAHLSAGDGSRDVSRLRMAYGWLLLRTAPPDPAGALGELERAHEELFVVGSQVDLGRCEVELARANLMLGNVDVAEELGASSLNRLRSVLGAEVCEARIVCGDVRAYLGSLDAAAAHYAAAADRLGMLAMGRRAAGVWRALADRLARAGDTPGAVAAYARALSEVGIRDSAYPMVDAPQQARES